VWLKRSKEMSKFILVIDDSLTVRKIIEVTLQREGHRVIGFPDGIEDLRAFTSGQIKSLPDLILLDIELPKASGYEIARYLKTRPDWAKVVIVMISRHNGVIDRLRARLAGAQAYLTKPITTDLLLETINRHLNSTAIG